MNVFVGYELCIQNKYFFRLIWSLWLVRSGKADISDVQ
jgi:hypothetical protein